MANPGTLGQAPGGPALEASGAPAAPFCAGAPAAGIDAREIAAALGPLAQPVADSVIVDLPARRPDAPSVALWAPLRSADASAALLALADERPPDVSLTLGFCGERAAELPACTARSGFALDHPGEVGAVVTTIPSLHRIEVRMLQADGDDVRIAVERAAQSLRALGGQTVVEQRPDGLNALVRCAQDQRPELLAGIVGCCHEAANAPDACCDVDVRMIPLRDGCTRLLAIHPAVRHASAALRSLEVEPRHVDATELPATWLPVRLASGQPVVSLGAVADRDELLAMARALARQGGLQGED